MSKKKKSRFVLLFSRLDEISKRVSQLHCVWQFVENFWLQDVDPEKLLCLIYQKPSLLRRKPNVSAVKKKFWVCMFFFFFFFLLLLLLAKVSGHVWCAVMLPVSHEVWMGGLDGSLIRVSVSDLTITPSALVPSSVAS